MDGIGTGLRPHAGLPAPKLGSERALALRERAHELIPGGAHTYPKGDDQFPELAPTLLVRGEGCRVWDVDGNEFIEYGMGLRAVTLGHAYPAVVEAAHGQMLLGENFTRPATIEVECAEAFLGHVNADMVKFTKDGSTATSGAVRLARAHTGRDLVAVCADHPFFSYDDWFIGTTPMDAGIPAAVRELTVAFRYNDLDSLRSLLEAHPEEIACVILEAEKNDEPVEGFLPGVQELCARHGAIFILDEMITGFRWHVGGAQAIYGLEPDLTTFGKAMANGFSVSALAGRRELMELGGLRTDKERVFLLSTTHGAENHALAAAIATMGVYAERDVVGALWDQGEKLRAGVEEAAREAGVEEYFGVAGKPCSLIYFTRDQDGKPSQPFRTLFLQETINRGLIAPSLVVSLAHDDAAIALSVEAIGEALEVYARALEDGVEHYLKGRPVKPAHRRHA